MAKITFRAITKLDLAKLMEWRVSEEVTKYLYTDPVLDMEMQEEWFEKISNSEQQQCWIVTFNDLDFAFAQLHDINFRHFWCFYGYYIGDKSLKDNGLSKHISCNVYDYAFFTLGMNKVCAEIFDANEKVVMMAKKRGYLVEGVFKQHVFKNGQFYDVVRMSFMKKVWERVRPGIDYHKVEIK